MREASICMFRCWYLNVTLRLISRFRVENTSIVVIRTRRVMYITMEPRCKRNAPKDNLFYTVPTKQLLKWRSRRRYRKMATYTSLKCLMAYQLAFFDCSLPNLREQLTRLVVRRPIIWWALYSRLKYKYASRHPFK